MNHALPTVAPIHISRLSAVQFGLLVALFGAAINPVFATQNNSGRYVVPTPNGQWRAVDYSSHNGKRATFYPSWYAGVNVSQSEWKSGESSLDSTGAGLVLGNHFKPHWRWELRHRYQEPKSTNDGGGRHSLSSFSADYIVAEPEDGASALLRMGVAQASGSTLSSEHGSAEALLGLGLQWREGRWLARVMVEQMGEDQRWAGVSLAGYFGGGEQAPKKSLHPSVVVAPATVAAPVVLERAPSATAKAQEQIVERSETPARFVAQPQPHLPLQPQAECKDVFATRLLEGIEYSAKNSAQLSRKSAEQLAQIGSSYAKRDYINVLLQLSAATEALASDRASSVIAALNKSRELYGRIESESVLGEESLVLVMKDGRRCR